MMFLQPTIVFISNSKNLGMRLFSHLKHNHHARRNFCKLSWREPQKVIYLQLSNSNVCKYGLTNKGSDSHEQIIFTTQNRTFSTSLPNLLRPSTLASEKFKVVRMTLPLSSILANWVIIAPLNGHSARRPKTTSTVVEKDTDASCSLAPESEIASGYGYDSTDQSHRPDISGSDELSYNDGLQPSQDAAVKKKGLSELAGTTFNLAPLVERSVALQNLVRLGVDLSKVEKVDGMADHLVMSDFDKDILPYLQHLAKVGVEPEKLGYVISTNPRMLQVPLDNLEAQVGYLLSKKFTLPEVASMVTRAPVVLQMDPQGLDAKLGFLQNAFKLSGHDVRVVALTFPKLLPWKREKISAIRSTLKEFLGFSDPELRKMIVVEPKLFTANKHKVMKAFDFVHNAMLIPHKQIVAWPSILRRRCHIIKSRHLFLLHKGRAQYDPCKENYISTKALMACNDENFCRDVAKCDTSEYFSFLKTL